MAKKKVVPPVPDADPPRAQLSVINLKGSMEYVSWLEAANKKTHIPKSAIVRLGISMWAKANGLDPPPEL